jgi:hypothetical protein
MSQGTRNGSSAVAPQILVEVASVPNASPAPTSMVMDTAHRATQPAWLERRKTVTTLPPSYSPGPPSTTTPQTMIAITPSTKALMMMGMAFRTFTTCAAAHRGDQVSVQTVVPFADSYGFPADTDCDDTAVPPEYCICAVVRHRIEQRGMQHNGCSV